MTDYTSLFNDAEDVEMPSSRELVEGTYTATITNASLALHSDRTPHPTTSIEFTIQEPEEFAKRKVWRNGEISPDKIQVGDRTFSKAQFVKQDVLKLGFTDSLSDITELGAFLADSIGKRVKVYVKPTKSQKTGKVYNNCYINELVDDTYTEPPKTDEDDDFGF